MTVEAGPSTPARSPALAGKRSNTVTPKRELETEDDVVYTPVASRKRSKATKSPNGSGKKPRPFAGPEVYAHLKPVTDHLKADLDSEYGRRASGQRTEFSRFLWDQVGHDLVHVHLSLTRVFTDSPGESDLYTP